MQLATHLTLRLIETPLQFFCKPLRWSAWKAECNHVRLFIMTTEAAVGSGGSIIMAAESWEQ